VLTLNADDAVTTGRSEVVVGGWLDGLGAVLVAVDGTTVNVC
jgi:hypothetical protein